MKTSDFYYDLPDELIAQEPIKHRSSSRLLVLNKETGEIKHGQFTDILDYINPGDCLVFNNTKVIPARIMGRKENTGAKIETLLLSKKEGDVWEALVKPGRKAIPGTVIEYGDGELKGQVLEIGEGGIRLIRFIYEGIFEEILDKLGEMPLPPYIQKKLDDRNRYQTVYAKENGSAAAPTAGLHFTKELLLEIQRRGIKKAELTLHVGLGTFRPVKVENVLEHKMHQEWYYLSDENAKLINETKQKGGRIVCVGTTSVRTIETCAGENNVKPGSGETDIFIYPGYTFKATDALITNFHLPESTLLMLTSALAGKENMLSAYNEAVKRKYRFFSFGDAMLIV